MVPHPRDEARERIQAENHLIQSLNDAMRLFGLRDLSMLPVVDSRNKMRLVGILLRRDVLNAYRRALLERQVPDLDGERRPG